MPAARRRGRATWGAWIATWTLAACSQAPDTSIDLPPPHVEVATVELVPARPSSRHLELLQASRRSRLAPRVGSTVAQVLVQEEDRVEAGQTLVRLVGADAQGNMLAVQGSREQIRALLKDTEAELARARSLAAQGVESERAVERLENERDRLRAQLREVRGNLLRARDRRSATALVAPFAGVVTRVDTEVGEYAAPGTPLATVSDLDPLAIEFTVTEREISLHRKGGLRFEVTVHGEPVPSDVDWISSEADPGSASFPVRLIVPNPDLALRAGLTAEVRVYGSEAAPEPAVPPTAVRYQGARPFVFRLDGDVIHSVPIRVGEDRKDRVTIEGPLQPGDRVVAAGPFNLADGDEVVPASAEATAPGGAPAGDAAP